MNMMCIKCNTKAVVSLKHLGSFCSKCFLSTIEKRIRKDLNINKVFAPHESVLVVNNSSLKAKLTVYFLNSISKSIPLKIDIKTAQPKKKYDKIITPCNLDDDISLFFESLARTGEPIAQTKEVHLLRTISNEEILITAKLLKIKGPFKKSKLSGILDKLESRYPGSKFGLFNSIKELK